MSAKLSKLPQNLTQEDLEKYKRELEEYAKTLGQKG